MKKRSEYHFTCACGAPIVTHEPHGKCKKCGSVFKLQDEFGVDRGGSEEGKDG